ncbi:Protein N-acetyltransferase, RimJ/RimL family [Lentibacillus persicus]|uniref:Lysine N-acyltransferase MbtK n=1 Tax=Lentibacillus persicus TaxID=640948 RepID=A0A1I2AVW7_9BACI|nr:GNAT family N-acetyltransferase [Lentibacillus persicus]SFE47877.1 Protein N-acetyltransferase, RimJ/RimL family [Lentibacillus persicus]
MNQYPQVFNRAFNQTISFRPVEFERDVERLHSWHQKSHVIPFWQQNMRFPKYKQLLCKLLEDTHQRLWIGEIDGDPMSYWETYWVQDDVLGDYYETDPYDQGVHLLIGKPEYLGKGYALPMLRVISDYLFTDNNTKRIVSEPDYRNDKMIHIFLKCGFQPIKMLQLPDKKAQFMSCERNEFKRRWESITDEKDI